jgi:hypothetical protein
MYVEKFKTDIIVFICNVIMCLIIFSITVSPLILNISLSEKKCNQYHNESYWTTCIAIEKDYLTRYNIRLILIRLLLVPLLYSFTMSDWTDKSAVILFEKDYLTRYNNNNINDIVSCSSYFYLY